MGRCLTRGEAGAARGRAGLSGGRLPGGRGRAARGGPAGAGSCRLCDVRAAPWGRVRGASRLLPRARRPLRGSPEEKATAAPRSVCPVHPPGSGMAAEQSLADQGARQPVSLIPWSLCRRDGDRLDSASLKELRNGVWPGRGRRQEDCSRPCSRGTRADHA